MKILYILAILSSSTLLANQSHKECVDEATRKYDACMELAEETLANKHEGVNTDAHSQKEAKDLQQGGCKKLFDKDLQNCPKE